MDVEITLHVNGTTRRLVVDTRTTLLGPVGAIDRDDEGRPPR